MPNAAFCTGLQTLAKFEAARVGVQWDNIFMEVSLQHNLCQETCSVRHTFVLQGMLPNPR